MTKQRAKAAVKTRKATKPKAGVAAKKKGARGGSATAKATQPKTTPKKTAARGASPKKKAARAKPASKKTAKRSAAKTTKRTTAKTPSRAKPASPPKPKVQSDDNNHQPQAKQRKRSSRLTPEDLRVFRDLLLDKRAELAGDVTNLRREAMRRDHQENDHNMSNMPTHMADLGSDNWEQEFTLGLLDKDMTLLKEIDDALERINDGSYGLCLATEMPIGKARLRAKPWARYCIDYATKLEKGLV